MSQGGIDVIAAGAQSRIRAASRPYYGWVIVGVAALAMVGTLPGRTQGLGLITERLLADLGISRVVFGQINLAATLIGALFCAGIGSLVDRRGSRLVLTILAALLGLVTLAMSQVAGAISLVVLVTLTRGLGQSALSIVSLAMVGKWFRRRLTLAMAVYSLVMSIGFMIAFPVVGAMVQASGWRLTWAGVGMFLLLVIAPVGWFLDRSSPETIGVEPDGGERAAGEPELPSARATLGEALRSPAFWVVALASSMYGLIASGIGLFNESILAERGFEASVYHTALAVTAITALAGNFTAGAIADRGSLRQILVVALLILTVALAALAHVTTVAHVMAQAVAMGVAGGFVMVVFFSFWGRAYGREHLGRIQGAAQALTVLGSALGPLFLALFVDTTGSYAAGFYTLAAAVAILAVAAAVVPVPAGARARA
jgi:MFS family permease